MVLSDPTNGFGEVVRVVAWTLTLNKKLSTSSLKLSMD